MSKRASFGIQEVRLIERHERCDFFVPGSFVRLNSGSPIGVVTDVSQDGTVSVTWLTNPVGRTNLPEQCFTPVL
jgi:hypothetical protein